MDSTQARMPVEDAARLLPHGMGLIVDAAKQKLVRPVRQNGVVTLSVREVVTMFQAELGQIEDVLPTMSAEETRSKLGVDGKGLERLVTGFWLTWNPADATFPAKLVRYWAALVKHDPTNELTMAFRRAADGARDNPGWNRRPPASADLPAELPPDEAPTRDSVLLVTPLLALEDEPLPVPAPVRRAPNVGHGTGDPIPVRRSRDTGSPNPAPGPDGADRRYGGPPPRGNPGR